MGIFQITLDSYKKIFNSLCPIYLGKHVTKQVKIETFIGFPQNPRFFNFFFTHFAHLFFAEINFAFQKETLEVNSAVKFFCLGPQSEI